MSTVSSENPIRAAVLTISDRCSRGEAVDTAGPAVATMLNERLGARIDHAEIIPDDPQLIASRLVTLADEDYDLAVTAGGTGCAPRDQTPEATRGVLDRELPGMAEAMRAASLRVTPHAMLSRGVVGLRGTLLIVNLPGSLRAATENLETLLPALPHAIRQAHGKTAHPETDARPGKRA